MKIGVNVHNSQPWTTVETITALGDRAEALGFDSLWVSDHVVVPEQIESTYPYGPPGSFTADNRDNYFEPITVLTYLAGRTQKAELGVSVLVVPQRQPLVAAKQWATLDALSNGRTILGVGAGWMREEFVALGADTFDRRGKALDEAIRLFRTVWTQPGPISFEGEVYRFEQVRVLPKPVRPGGPPIWIGGHGRRSLRRAAELGNGWQGVRMSLEELTATRATLHELLARYNRQPSDLELAMSFALYAPGTQPAGQAADADFHGSPHQISDQLGRYQALGLQHAILQLNPTDSPVASLEALEFFASDVRPLVES